MSIHLSRKPLMLPNVTQRTDLTTEEKKNFWSKGANRLVFSNEEGKLNQISRMVAGRILPKDPIATQYQAPILDAYRQMSWYEKKTCVVVRLGNDSDVSINIRSFAKWMYDKGDKKSEEFKNYAFALRDATSKLDTAKKDFDKASQLKVSPEKYAKAKKELDRALKAHTQALDNVQEQITNVVSNIITPRKAPNLEEDLKFKKPVKLASSSSPSIQALRAAKLATEVRQTKALETGWRQLQHLQSNMRESIQNWDDKMRDLIFYATSSKPTFLSETYFGKADWEKLQAFESRELEKYGLHEVVQQAEKMSEIFTILEEGLKTSELMTEKGAFFDETIREAFASVVEAERETLKIGNQIQYGVSLPPEGMDKVEESFKGLIKEADPFIRGAHDTAKGKQAAELQLAHQRLLFFVKEGVDSQKDWRVQMNQVIGDLNQLLISAGLATKQTNGKIEFASQGSDLAKVYEKTFLDYAAFNKRVEQDAAIEKGKSEAKLKTATKEVEHPRSELGRKLGTLELMMKEFTPKLIAEIRKRPLNQDASNLTIKLKKMQNSSLLKGSEDHWKVKDGEAEKWLDLIERGLLLTGQIKQDSRKVTGHLSGEFAELFGAYNEARKEADKEMQREKSD